MSDTHRKILKEYGLDLESDKKKHYKVEIERKQYRPGIEPEKKMMDYSNYGRMTVAEMKKIFADY